MRWTAVATILRMLGMAIVAVPFAGLVAGAIWLFYNGYSWPVATGAILATMIVAWCGGRSFSERWAMCLAVPFLVLGGCVGGLAYFGMFHWPWFEAIFNNDGLGPLGLITSVLGCAVAFAATAGGLLHLLLSRFTGERPAEETDSSGVKGDQA